jgi:hypothetical protein
LQRLERGVENYGHPRACVHGGHVTGSAPAQATKHLAQFQQLKDAGIERLSRAKRISAEALY